MTTSPQQDQWKDFERLAEQFYKTFATNASVTYNDKIVGKSGIQRQIDLCVRSSIGPHTVFIAVECRDYKTHKVDINHVEAFNTKKHDVLANLGVIISNAGFTEGAIAQGRECGISLCSLFDAEHKDWGVEVRIPTVFDFRKPSFSAQFTGTGYFELPANLNELVLEDEEGKQYSLASLFLEAWNSGRIDAELGDKEYVPEKKVSIDLRGKKYPIELRFRVRVTNRLFFGWVGLVQGMGFIDVLKEAVTTRSFTTEGIDMFDVETKWQQIASIEEVPKPPFMVSMALDTFRVGPEWWDGEGRQPMPLTPSPTHSTPMNDPNRVS